jgi:hypothetical protein
MSTIIQPHTSFPNSKATRDCRIRFSFVFCIVFSFRVSLNGLAAHTVTDHSTVTARLHCADVTSGTLCVPDADFILASSRVKAEAERADVNERRARGGDNRTAMNGRFTPT